MSDRRRFLLTTTALAGGLLCARVAAAQAHPGRAELLREVTGGAAVQTGRVTVDTPPLADNGHSVAVRVLVDSPMSAQDHVRRITLLAERNPRPVVASFTLGPHSGKAEVATRIRLADIQDVLALAQMSDGSWWMGGAHVVVTELACLEG
ncbi:MAG: sulfur oxidation protein SoxY [Burkholderiales bacterium]|nr:sulfur oxidation protein SoxY [Burkholderiales bacterium]